MPHTNIETENDGEGMLSSMVASPLASCESTRRALTISLLITLLLGGGFVFAYWAYRGSILIAASRSSAFAAAMLLTHIVGYRLYQRQASGAVRYSPLYRNALTFAACADILFLLLGSLILMSGLMKLFLIAAAGHWAGVGLIVLARPTAPRKDDLQFILGGFLASLLIVIFLTPFGARLAGWH